MCCDLLTEAMVVDLLGVLCSDEMSCICMCCDLLTEAMVVDLLGVLCSDEMSSREHLEMQQALFKQFAEILDFTLKFDDLKVYLFDLVSKSTLYVQ